jgi:hypothetical protein
MEEKTQQKRKKKKARFSMGPNGVAKENLDFGTLQ